LGQISIAFDLANQQPPHSKKTGILSHWVPTINRRHCYLACCRQRENEHLHSSNWLASLECLVLKFGA